MWLKLQLTIYFKIGLIGEIGLDPKSFLQIAIHLYSTADNDSHLKNKMKHNVICLSLFFYSNLVFLAIVYMILKNSLFSNYPKKY